MPFLLDLNSSGFKRQVRHQSVTGLRRFRIVYFPGHDINCSHQVISKKYAKQHSHLDQNNLDRPLPCRTLPSGLTPTFDTRD